METGKIQHLEPHIKEENRSFRVGRKMLYSLTWERPLREMKTEVANQTLHQMPDTSAVLGGPEEALVSLSLSPHYPGKGSGGFEGEE